MTTSLAGLSGGRRTHRDWLEVPVIDCGVRMARGLAMAVTPVVVIGVALAIMTTPALAGVVSPDGPIGLAEVNQVAAGADVSYPQCGGALPFGQAFGVVGVNYGRDNTRNPCLDEELAWAAYQSTGATSEPKVSVYLNTGEPGNSYAGQGVEDWPVGGNSPWGTCLPTMVVGRLTGPGQVSIACAWVYGYQKASQDLYWLQAAASRDGLPPTARAYPVWLDVETSNTWQSSTQLNLADLAGMVYGLRQAGVASLGVYAFPPEWAEITGGTPTSASGSLYPLSDWLLGAPSLSAAQSSCQEPPFTGGRVELTQFPDGSFDGDYAC